ncbi:LRIG3 [Branchiostoma lanceolatum]|uniref:LRIG3 protein n=1 Tax=Branchiostoma lanceolatum TaxID=7740 RepID=A0A8K0EJP5_BRALA|nr:LRIG3 [Branchiostoma lanceolatum]
MAMSRLWLLVLLMARCFVGCFSCVNLECCDVSGGDPPTVINCTTTGNLQGISTVLNATLKILVMKSQTIKVIKRRDLPYLPDLHVLGIISSRVATVGAGSFQSLPNLTTLDLCGNNIRKLTAGTFTGLQKLKILILQTNQIRSVDGGTFVELHQLQSLDLSSNCLSRIPKDIWLLTSVLEVNLVFNNILQSPLEDLQKFEGTKGMNLVGTGQQAKCDCTLRGIKELISRNKRLSWDIRCTGDREGHKTFLANLGLDSLICEAPKVSVVPNTQVWDLQETASFTCAADECKEHLYFSWHLPNGEELPSTFEYSRQFTKEDTPKCREGYVRTYEKRTVCYSVLNINAAAPGSEHDVSGTYTCWVTGNYTQNASASAVLTVRHTQPSVDMVHDKTTPQQHTSATPCNHVEGQDNNVITHENKNMSVILVSERTPGSRGNISSVYAGMTSVFIIVCVTLVVFVAVRKVRTRRKERDGNGQRKVANQMSKDEDDTKTYENDDQFLNEEDSGNRGTYENDDQFVDEEDSSGRGIYENDDQFSDEQYSGTGTFSDEGTEERPYENDDQFSDIEETGHAYDNDFELSSRDKDVSRKHRLRKMSDTASTRERGKGTGNAVGAGPSRKPRRINRRKLRASMCKVTVVEEEIPEGHYDNDTRRGGQVRPRAVGSHMGTEILRHGTSQDMAEEAGGYDNERQRRDGVSRKPANGSSCSDVSVKNSSETGFGHYDNEMQKRDRISARPENTSRTRGRHCVRQSSVVAARRKARKPADTRPCDNVDETPGAEPNTEGINDYIAVKCDSTSEPDYLDIQKTNTATNNTSTNDISDDNDSEYFALPGPSRKPTDNFLTHETTNVATEHDYVTLPNTDNKIDDDIANHDYITLPNTSKTIDDDSSGHDYISLPNTDNKTDDDISEHDYVTFPNTKMEDDTSSEHQYVTFPDNCNV